MTTFIKVSLDLISEAQLLARIKSKKEAAEEALKLFIALNKQAEMKKLRGKLHHL